MNIPRRGVVGWSRTSRNLLVPDHGERMSGRNESDSKVQRGACLASRLSRDVSMRAFVQSHHTQQGAHESRVRRSRRSIEAVSGPDECWQGAATVDFSRWHRFCGWWAPLSNTLRGGDWLGRVDEWPRRVECGLEVRCGC